MVGWGRPVRECPEGQTAYLGFARDQICNNHGSPRRVLAKKESQLWHWFQRKPYLLQAFAGSAVPGISQTACCRAHPQGCPWAAAVTSLRGGIDFQRLWRRLHLYHFLWNKSYFLLQLCIIFIMAYWSKPGPLSKQRGNLEPLPYELVFQQKTLVLQSQFFCVSHCAFTKLPPPAPHPSPQSITLRRDKWESNDFGLKMQSELNLLSQTTRGILHQFQPHFCSSRTIPIFIGLIHVSCLCGPLFGIRVLNFRKMLNFMHQARKPHSSPFFLSWSWCKDNLLCILAKNVLNEPHKETYCEVTLPTRMSPGTEADIIVAVCSNQELCF